MPNLRLVTDNAIERATLSASSTAGTNAALYLASDLKDYLWRGLSKIERLDATWTTPEPISAVGAPYCNWSPTAMWRIRLSNENAATNLVRYSEAFDNAAWTKTAGITVSTVGTGPDGVSAARRIQFTAANQVVSQGTTLGVGVVCSGSVWAIGTLGQTLTVNAGGVNQTFTLTGDWQRLRAENKTSTSALFEVSTNNSATARDVRIWGAQLETGAIATSYYPTTAAAATRPAGYIDTWQSYDYDSGWVQACPVPATQLRRMTAAQAASAYAWGGGAFARHWMPAQVTARRLAIDIKDPDNLQGYVEATQLVAAPYFEAKNNADYGADATPVDSTQVSRSGAGSLMATQSTRSSEVKFSLSKMNPSDADYIWRALRSNGKGYPIWVSLFPESTDLAEEARHQVWGNFKETPSMALPSFKKTSATLTVQSS